MSIADDLRLIAQGTQRELDAVHDFFEYSKFVWRSFQILVEEGHQLVAENAATGHRIDQHGLLSNTSRYARDYLATFTFRQFVSTFEVFLFKLLHRLLVHNPWQFAKSQMEFEVVLKAGDRDEVIAAVVLKQLNELKYENVREWFVALDKAVKLECLTDAEIDGLAEIKATRDILEHNAGVANAVYLRKAGKLARHANGDRIEIDDTYYLESWRLIKKVVTDVATAAAVKLTEP